LANPRTIPQIKSRRYPSKSVTIHYSSVTPIVDVTSNDTQTEL